jgi:hypothetical protein
VELNRDRVGGEPSGGWTSTLASLTAAGNAAEGVLLADAGVARMTASTLADNGGPGLVMPGGSASTGTIGKNTIVGNQMEGILGPGGGSKFVFDSNVIGGNLQDGLKLGPSTAGLIVTKNSLFGNGKNGLIVSPPIDSGLFKSNAAVGNTLVGLDIEVAGSTVTKNVGGRTRRASSRPPATSTAAAMRCAATPNFSASGPCSAAPYEN